MKDEILEELWRVKDQISDEAKGNTQALFDRLRNIKLTSTQRMVNRTAPRKPQHA
ncbi:MAG: hypothetical protein QGH42_02060 [Kiritimatiellia bacterium]|jgi:hypothetical protein|nr:hypothetical protein [Kiritimatiellia bacterium]MDP6809283.1 hypothetical protein [Kiritimatiellia bacterium]MDP7023021.1 hypothetical protein [Kiritimatiellia bacterium]